MFQLTINTDNPAIIAAIANAVKNCPPVGFVSVDAGVTATQPPPEVVIHTTKDKVEEAKAAVNATPEAKVTIEEPIVKEEPKATPTDDVKVRGQRLRELMLAVSKLPNRSIADAKTIAANAAGIAESDLKALPEHPKADNAIKALEAALNGSGHQR